MLKICLINRNSFTEVCCDIYFAHKDINKHIPLWSIANTKCLEEKSNIEDEECKTPLGE